MSWAALVCVVAAVSVRAQEVGLQVRTKDGRTEYQMGEPITLEVVFTSASKEYLVDTSTRDPDLVATRDEIRVEPRDGWEDPLMDYRRALNSRSFFASGGLTGMARTGEKPVTIEFRLNHSVRFTKPGQYILHLQSRRASSVRTSMEVSVEPLELESDSLRLTILPESKEWQKQQLHTAMESLRKPQGSDPLACDVVESLGTEASEIAMALALASEKNDVRCNFMLALIGVGHREAVLKRMHSELEDPAASVTPGFVEAMAMLTSVQGGAAEDFFQKQLEARASINKAIWEHLEEKKGAARIAAINTLVEGTLNGRSASEGAGEAEVLRLAAENFEQLSLQARYTLLSSRWREIASPAMVPALRRCAEEENSGCADISAELLLARLNELSPKDAREVILAQIGKAQPRFTGRALEILPDKELPELDGVLLEHLQSKEGNLDATAALIERYASGGIAGAVASFLDKNDPSGFGGETQQNLIGYLYRVQPELAEQRLRRALAARGGTPWYRYMLAQVAQKNPQAKLQDVAIEALRDEDYEVVGSAVQALEMTGDVKGKEALLERLQQWHDSWMGRKQQISSWFFDGAPNDDRYLGDAFFQALGRGTGWLLNQEDQQRLLRMALTENQKQTAEQTVEAARTRPVMFWVNAAGEPNVSILVGQYSYEKLELAERKILQYPRGTAFRRQVISPESVEAGKVIAALEEFMTANGMKLEKQTAAN
jgi:hypothetical protein